ncbi:hypothetical protein CY34DRAFT_395363 [Suillus luteus UH-Slu-Lm8-n1]|uniref:Uncharacterized protein n=1 Tax=Suillus luteus UH-Slu-Lm8-n1 TaxID=930992 RepID=A0A0D0B3D3_9AGAM|nr:hypothetical protein CY34DRAFT_395363 [Suillus luteus UH-Slu-Lm8-n1]
MTELDQRKKYETEAALLVANSSWISGNIITPPLLIPPLWNSCHLYYYTALQ